MGNDILPLSSPTGEALAERVQDLLGASVAPSTMRAYRSDWQHFTSWCEQYGATSLPAAPSTVAAYLADLSRTHAPSTCSRRVAAINLAHKTAALTPPSSDPLVVQTLKGLRREWARDGGRVRRVSPVGTDQLIVAIDRMELTSWPGGVGAVRDRALLLVGFAGARRRSELSALTWDRISPDRDGLIVRLGVTKTDQEGVGLAVFLPRGRRPETCPPCALAAWRLVLAAADTQARQIIVTQMSLSEHICGVSDLPVVHGPVFRPVNRHGTPWEYPLSDHAIARIVKKRVGGDPALVSGHSLRAGFVTEALRNGATAMQVKRQTHHKSDAMIEVYYRDAAIAANNAVNSLRL